MQIKLVILTICASLVAIGFAAPSPQADAAPPGDDNLQAFDTSDATADPNTPPPEGPSPQALDLVTESFSDDISPADFDLNAPSDAAIDAAIDTAIDATDPNADGPVPPSDGSSPQFFTY
ncbi:uncharacterized protein RHIMIDRAFT_279356 [Rhizopus microsporus ATCC 52813]|uniref:Uncharacterized protein n=1 Tax=Rhizopus microsporus ATCC 52813 TaxID=1340429 RepID=A0A2G4SXE2_RHIZD|nr:uncharacterized protein RHIMIDRAFT_279316 [Rhizopus microsporus ATCC 52813]XP_023467147.1 uncharacterized protein RHIMIDRAFT_279356 [Rhizopus microsporus ATCC 52813]PHZ13428.1 hypothetical protein RHIMIDRAFT_279316 [Rhizopus microsporus ATCC 52813]PHZ13439.1 hypothetical protein RHIMIDRAFT_279356 [Rhizopus microsporus ATCC 52813]